MRSVPIVTRIGGWPWRNVAQRESLTAVDKVHATVDGCLGYRRVRKTIENGRGSKQSNSIAISLQ